MTFWSLLGTYGTPLFSGLLLGEDKTSGVRRDRTLVTAEVSFCRVSVGIDFPNTNTIHKHLEGLLKPLSTDITKV